MTIKFRESDSCQRGFDLKLFAILIALVMVSDVAKAAIRTANSASLADVQAAVNAASDGDTVMIPNGSVTWTGGISTSKQIIIRAQNYTPTSAGMAGSGATSRSVTIANSSSSPLFAFTSGNSYHCGVAGIRFNESGGSGAHISIAGSGTKVPLINDCYFQNRSRNWPDQACIVVSCRGGVMWNCVMEGTQNLGTVGEGSLLIKGVPRAWATASTMGMLDSAGDINFYIEDSTFRNVGNCPDMDDGARAVIRYFVYDGAWGETHGFTSSFGGRHWEYYNGSFRVTTDQRNISSRYFWCRAGTGIFTDNEVQNAINPGAYGAPSQLIIGDNTNPGSYPQARQPGWGHNGSANVLDPIYIWNQTGPRAYTVGFNGSWNSIVQQNREYYVNNGAKPGYTKFTYPHPLRGGGPPTQDPPSIAANPQSVVRLQGESVSFTVTVNGSSPLSYQWQKNQVNISGATSSSYTISSPQLSDAGSFRCVVSNPYGSVTTAAATLSVNVPVPVPPTITTGPQSLTRTIGQSATFNVTASGDAPLSYQWQKNQVNIAGATSSSYTISSAQLSDAGSFRCVVSNALGSATSAAATLTVNVPVPVPPTITASPQSLTRTVGQSATFNVTASGDAPLSYQWQKNQVNIAGATSSSYTISSPQLGDAGNFRCVVSNALGSATSAAATLIVNVGSAGNLRYVDQTAGNDGNAGTEASPWQRCPGMVGWTGSATLQPGDTVYFDRSDSWDIAQNTGGPGLDLKAGVHYIGDEWDPQSVGAGRATFRATGRHEAGVVRFWEDHASIPTWFEGFEVNANGQRANLIEVNHSFWKTGLTKAVKRIEDCVAHGNSGNGSQGDYKYGIIVSDNSPDASGWVANVEILDTVVYNVPRDGICLYPGNSGMISNVVVRGCEVYNTGNDPSYSEGHGLMFKGNVKNSVFEYSYAHDVNSSAVFINGPEAGTGTGPTGCVVRYCVLQTVDNNGVIRFYGTGNKAVDVYGNIILENETTGGLSLSGNSGIITANIYNNTFFDAFVDLGNPSGSGTINFRNNIIYELDDVCLTDSGGDLDAHSHNLFYRANGGTLVSISGVNYNAGNIAAWESTVKTTNPLFKNVSNLPTGHSGSYGSSLAPNADGLSLQTGSPALNAGTDLGGAYSGSINSTARPTGSAWDIGAYEGVSTGQAVQPPAPTGLRISGG